MKPCTNRSFASYDHTGRRAVVVPCEYCGHTSVLHPGRRQPVPDRVCGV